MGFLSPWRRKEDISSVTGQPAFKWAGVIFACSHSKRPFVGDTQNEVTQPALPAAMDSGSNGGRNSSSSMARARGGKGRRRDGSMRG